MKRGKSAWHHPDFMQIGERRAFGPRVLYWSGDIPLWARRMHAGTGALVAPVPAACVAPCLLTVSGIVPRVTPPMLDIYEYQGRVCHGWTYIMYTDIWITLLDLSIQHLRV